MALTILPAHAADEQDWRILWAAYCQFYKADVSPGQTSLTWKRILDPGQAIGCFIARNGDGNGDGETIGMVTYLIHPSTWLDVGDCYLEDLFVSDKARGLGAGRALINSVKDAATSAGCERLYWMTNIDNNVARALYDKIAGPEDKHVRYRMVL